MPYAGALARASFQGIYGGPGVVTVLKQEQDRHDQITYERAREKTDSIAWRKRGQDFLEKERVGQGSPRKPGSRETRFTEQRQYRSAMTRIEDGPMVETAWRSRPIRRQYR